ncbi:hypothetical protein [uncultured Gammaproteobacteria bacterium]|nr:hypothetical protein [uncultured Gammaproteobacteria bacterium]
MLNKIIITFVLSTSLSVSAFFPSLDDFPKFPKFPKFPEFPEFPELPRFGEFDPVLLQKFYNQFTDAKPDFEREDRLASLILFYCRNFITSLPMLNLISSVKIE